MKRRQFLTAAAGIAGSFLPALGRAENKPCPPGNFVAKEGTGVNPACGATAGDAPSWFVSMPERQWVAVAGGSGQRLIDVYHQVPLGVGGTFPDVCKAWTGGCVDQTRGELIFAANGGHANYAGNEVYACAIRSESPRWYRLTDPSPAEVIKPAVGSGTVSTGNASDQQGNNPDGYAAMFRDGRMRSVHGWHSVQFANGKIWYPTQSSPTGNGYSTHHAWSFDRNFAGIPQESSAPPLPWTDNPGPWTWLGTTENGARGIYSRGIGFGTAPPSALDPVTGKIWTANAEAASSIWSSLDTTTGLIQRNTKVNNFADITRQDGTWAVVVVDPNWDGANEASCRWRFWVAPAPKLGGLVVLNLMAPDPYSASAWSLVPVSDLQALVQPGLGAVYHKSSAAILLANPVGPDGSYGPGTGTVLIKLQVPLQKDGSYSSGLWQVEAVAAAEGTANPEKGAQAPHNGAWSKFNIIDNMGNGQSALVVCMEVAAPTYVYKLPSDGI